MEKVGLSMPAAYSCHRTSYVWLRCFHCVLGVSLEELNDHIDYYNNSGRWLTFWEYLTFEFEQTVYGFDCIWNEDNPLMSQVHIIKEARFS